MPEKFDGRDQKKVREVLYLMYVCVCIFVCLHVWVWVYVCVHYR